MGNRQQFGGVGLPLFNCAWKESLSEAVIIVLSDLYTTGANSAYTSERAIYGI